MKLFENSMLSIVIIDMYIYFTSVTISISHDVYE